jgi:hypothetical protein
MQRPNACPTWENRTANSLEPGVLVVGEPVELRINAGFGRYVRNIAISMTDKNGKQWEILDAPGRIVDWRTGERCIAFAWSSISRVLGMCSGQARQLCQLLPFPEPIG